MRKTMLLDMKHVGGKDGATRSRFNRTIRRWSLLFKLKRVSVQANAANPANTRSILTTGRFQIVRGEVLGWGSLHVRVHVCMCTCVFMGAISSDKMAESS